jgi:hypothetical protein
MKNSILFFFCIDERIGAALGKKATSPVEFQPAESKPYGGVLFSLPFLLSNGLMSYREHYGERPGDYSGKQQRRNALLLYDGGSKRKAPGDDPDPNSPRTGQNGASAKEF